MARTIESIVDSHRRANVLRSEGKSIWTYGVHIKDILRESDDQSVERVADVSVRIAAALRAGLPAKFFDVTDVDYEMAIDEAVEDLESYTVSGLSALRDEEGVDPLEMFNGRLEEIYDWADRLRVWVG